jgi:hypothetical protein
MKTFFISASLCVALAAAAQPQPAPPSRTLLKLSPQHFIVNTLQVGVERFNTAFSGSWNYSLGIRNQGNDVWPGIHVAGVDGNLQYRRYFKPMLPAENSRKETKLPSPKRRGVDRITSAKAD